MKRLFDDKDKWTDEAQDLDSELVSLIEPFLKKYQGIYSLREIEYIVHNTISLCVASAILRAEQEERNAIEKIRMEKYPAGIQTPGLVGDIVENIFKRGDCEGNRGLLALIKECKRLTGVGLKEAKEWCEKNWPEISTDSKFPFDK